MLNNSLKLKLEELNRTNNLYKRILITATNCEGKQYPGKKEQENIMFLKIQNTQNVLKKYI